MPSQFPDTHPSVIMAIHRRRTNKVGNIRRDKQHFLARFSQSNHPAFLAQFSQDISQYIPTHFSHRPLRICITSLTLTTIHYSGTHFAKQFTLTPPFISGTHFAKQSPCIPGMHFDRLSVPIFADISHFVECIFCKI